MREEHGQRVPCNPRQVTGTRVPTPPLPLYPPTRTSWADPLHPPPEDTPFPQVNYSSEAGIKKYLASASKSALEVAVMTQDDRGKRFWLNSASLRGQAAELVARAEWPARYLRALPSRWMEDPWQAGTTRQVKVRPVRDRNLYKESPCTFPPLS